MAASIDVRDDTSLTLLDGHRDEIARDDDAPARSHRWSRIAAALREDIDAGRFAPGERLPNETALAARFGVHRHTLRQAVQRLALEGRVRVEQGRGTFVRELVLDYALGRRTRMTDNLARAGERARRELLGRSVEPAGEWAEPLGTARDARVEVLRSRAIVRGRPIGLSTTAYPADRLAGIGAAFGETGSVTAALARLGVGDTVRVRSAVSCRLPTSAEADALARAAGEPVLVVAFVNADARGVPVEAGRTLFAADAVQLVMEHGA
ncbi:MAG: GntR family transcriptional regulator, phosphonate transport system regulatory protein [Pseudomonadota bacterium]|jgi:GntR family phosphonate transport system transcriptional regulator